MWHVWFSVSIFVVSATLACTQDRNSGSGGSQTSVVAGIGGAQHKSAENLYELFSIDLATGSLAVTGDIAGTLVPPLLPLGSPLHAAVLKGIDDLHAQWIQQGRPVLTRHEGSGVDAAAIAAELGAPVQAPAEGMALFGGNRGCIRLTGASLLAIGALISAAMVPIDSAEGFAAACMIGGVGMFYLKKSK